MPRYEHINPEELAEKAFNARIPGRTYISQRFVDQQLDGSRNNVRRVRQVIDQIEHWSEALLKGEKVLRVTRGGREEIEAKVYEDTRGISVLTIQRYRHDTGRPIRENFSFVGNEITILKEFLEAIQYIDIPSDGRSRVEYNNITAATAKIRSILAENPGLDDVLIEMAQKKITSADVVALAYRKEQLEIFKGLLCDENSDESMWQNFFENNIWIFGYGLNFVFNSPLQGRKLEQVVRGADIKSAGKRADGVLKTRGIISSLCLVEIKTHSTCLLKDVNNSYRRDCWQVSNELSGAIAQVQKTVQKTVENIGTELKRYYDNGDPTGEIVFAYEPKSYLIVGSLAEFDTDAGVNVEKYSSFELFRKNIFNPDIITFDELYERARYIVQNNEENQIHPSYENASEEAEPVDDLPF